MVRTIHFKNNEEAFFFLAAISAEEITFDELRDEFHIPLESLFEVKDGADNDRHLISFEAAQAAGYRMLAMKEGRTDLEKVNGMCAITHLFYPQVAERNGLAMGWELRKDLQVYFIAPSVMNHLYMSNINYEFDKALWDIAKAYTVKQSGTVPFLHKKPWVVSGSQTAIKAAVGLRLIDFDVMASKSVLPGEDFMPMNARDEKLLAEIKKIEQKRSWRGRIKAAQSLQNVDKERGER